MTNKIINNYLKRSRLLSFNLANRDAWVAEQAQLLPRATKVLDVGAGSCPYRDLFAHCDYKTQDFGQLKNDQLRFGSYGKIDYACEATSIPVADGSFDAILCTEMLEHVPEPHLVIREFARILKPGGRLILTAPLGSGLHQEPYHFYGGFTPYWYQKFLADAGFLDILVTPNAGFYAFYAQESLRFLQLSNPLRLHAGFPIKLVWAPFWLLLLPLLGGVIPLIGHWFDRFDTEKKFTVGYHVIARRGLTRSEDRDNISPPPR